MKECVNVCNSNVTKSDIKHSWSLLLRLLAFSGHHLWFLSIFETFLFIYHCCTCSSRRHWSFVAQLILWNKPMKVGTNPYAILIHVSRQMTASRFSFWKSILFRCSPIERGGTFGHTRWERGYRKPLPLLWQDHGKQDASPDPHWRHALPNRDALSSVWQDIFVQAKNAPAQVETAFRTCACWTRGNACARGYYQRGRRSAQEKR